MAATTGFFRTNNTTSRAPQGLNLQVQPGASVYVTNTATGAAATIYSDAGLSVTIPLSTVTADVNGLYQYYIPLNYMVTENISSPNAGTIVIPNIGVNGPVVGSLTTTSATSDVFTAAGILSSSHVSITPTNASAATLVAGGSVYVSAKSNGSVTIAHSATAGATFDLLITPY